jgi:hypothetical protein
MLTFPLSLLLKVARSASKMVSLPLSSLTGLSLFFSNNYLTVTCFFLGFLWLNRKCGTIDRKLSAGSYWESLLLLHEPMQSEDLYVLVYIFPCSSLHFPSNKENDSLVLEVMFQIVSISALPD